MENCSCARMQGNAESHASYADNTCMKEPNGPIIERIFWLFEKVGRLTDSQAQGGKWKGTILSRCSVHYKSKRYRVVDLGDFFLRTVRSQSKSVTNCHLGYVGVSSPATTLSARVLGVSRPLGHRAASASKCKRRNRGSLNVLSTSRVQVPRRLSANGLLIDPAVLRRPLSLNSDSESRSQPAPSSEIMPPWQRPIRLRADRDRRPRRPHWRQA
jgi:hypothetical protein